MNTNKKHQITIEDVANALGYSKGLVSLAIRNKYGVSNETRSEIVLKAIEMGYEMKQKTLRNTKHITLLIKGIEVMKEEFWRDVISGIEQKCYTKDIFLNIVNWKNESSAETLGMSLYDSNSSGVIVLNQCPQEIIDNIAKFKIPIVLVDMINQHEGAFDQVFANNYLGGMLAMRYLIQNNHENIIIFGNNHYSFSFTQRYYGLLHSEKEATEKGLKLNIKTLSTSRNNESLYKDDFYSDKTNEDKVICNPNELKQFLKNHSEYQAIVCLNDAILEQAIKVCQDLNLNVPSDISIISFDDTSIAKSSVPPITSVLMPKNAMGQGAVNLLSEIIEKKRKITATLEFNTTIIERNSVKNLKESES